MEFFEKKSKELYSFLEDTFRLKKCKTWDQVALEITIERVKHTYKFFGNLFPRNYDYINEFSGTTTFRTIHYGDLKGNSIINDIVRFSLYSDEIFVFHPLQNPALTNHQLDPRKNPKYWLQDFISALYFYIVLKKWVELGIVKLIINPVEFDFQMRDSLHNQAVKRVEKFLNENAIPENNILETMAEQLAIEYGGRTIEWLKAMLLNMKNPKFTAEEAENLASRIKSVFPRRNPLYHKLRIPLSSGIVTDKMGGSLEEITFLTQITNSNIYTSNKMCWSMLKQIPVNDFWTKANFAYSNSNLNFLDNVDTSFVLNLRRDGRLSVLRNKLKLLFSELERIEITSVSDSKIYELNQQFVDAIKSSEADWHFIKQDAETKRKYWFTASLALPIIQHQVSFLPLLVGSMAWFGNNLNEEKLKLTTYRKKDPLSVFVDLKNKDIGFFSELKNCLF